MISIVRRTLSSLTFSSRSTFCQSYAAMKDALRQDLYSIELINKQVNRRLLAMAYTPGVGAVSEAIEQNHAEANQMTLRPRSVAILTDGSFLNASAQGVGPALDWIVAQIKYYSSLSAFPFVVEEGIDLGEALRDLSIAYGTVLYLDSKPLPKIPEDLLVVRHQDVVAKTSTELTEA